MLYRNGEIPLNKLIHLGGEHYLPPGTCARWQWLVANGKSKYGATLRISTGANGYRWLAKQVEAKNQAIREGRSRDAAAPGYSSHGGVVDGVVCMAIDVANWADLAPGNIDLAWSRFVALCRLAGFQTLTVPWERWHIVDYNDPWTVPTHLIPHPVPLPEEQFDILEDTMATLYQAGSPVVNVMAQAGLFWIISDAELASVAKSGAQPVWLEKVTLDNLIVDARASKSRGAGPMIVEFTKDGKTIRIFTNHGGAVILQNDQELANIKRILNPPVIKTTRARGDLIVANIRTGKDG